jgi:hypothetical protein
MSSSFREQWEALRAAPRELPMVYLIKILTSFGLYSTTIVLTLPSPWTTWPRAGRSGSSAS